MSDKEFWQLAGSFQRALIAKLQENEREHIARLTGDLIVYVDEMGHEVNRIEYHEGRETFWPVAGEDGWVDRSSSSGRVPVYFTSHAGWLFDFVGGDH